MFDSIILGLKPRIVSDLMVARLVTDPFTLQVKLELVDFVDNFDPLEYRHDDPVFEEVIIVSVAMVTWLFDYFVFRIDNVYYEFDLM